MDKWVTFDQLRARWEVEHLERRLQDRLARDDLKAHAVVFVMVVPLTWLLCATSGVPLVWPLGFTALWVVVLWGHAHTIGVTARLQRRAGQAKARVRVEH